MTTLKFRPETRVRLAEARGRLGAFNQTSLLVSATAGRGMLDNAVGKAVKALAGGFTGRKKWRRLFETLRELADILRQLWESYKTIERETAEIRETLADILVLLEEITDEENEAGGVPGFVNGKNGSGGAT